VPLPTSGPLSLQQIATEFKASNPVSLSQLYAGGGLVPAGTSGTYGPVPTSGTISLWNFYGTSNRVRINYVISSNTENAAVNISTLPGYLTGISDITITVDPGVYVWSNSVGSYALAVSGGTTGDTVTLVNQGFIMGRGGNGAGSGNGQSGGPAINMDVGTGSFTLDQTYSTAYIGGGGGGGAGNGGGGGAGGGSGGGGSAGGAIGNSGSSGGGGGGGGRIFPGSSTGGPNNGGSAGGAGSSSCGYGGGPDQGGGRNCVGDFAASGGGGWGAGGSGTTYGSTVGGGAGGAGGKAINLNSNSITYASGVNARIYGTIS